MICRECRADNEDWRHYCAQCGAVLAVAPDEGSPPQRAKEPIYAAPLTTSSLAVAAQLQSSPPLATAISDQPALAVQRGSLRSRMGITASLLALLAKALPILKFSKIMLTTGSMLLSVTIYAISFGLPIAVGLVALLFVHEMGHWLVLRFKGFGSSAIVFVPFFGAATAMRSQPANVRDEAEIGLGGPITGTFGALACLAVGISLHLYFWDVLAYFGLLLNLLNLIPMLPLDGGRIVAALSRWLWPVGLILLLGIFLVTMNSFVLIILVLGGLQTMSRFRAQRTPDSMPPGYYEISNSWRLVLGSTYFGLLLIIFITMMTIQHDLGLQFSAL